MICYYFPPTITAASNRSVGFARNLIEQGWDVRILTTRGNLDPAYPVGEAVNGDIPVYRSCEIDLKKIVRSISELLAGLGFTSKRNFLDSYFCTPDPKFGWLCLLKAIRLACWSDVIYVSCSPFSSAIIAAYVKKMSNRPLVCDFRDVWAQNPYRNYLRNHNSRAKSLEKFVLDRTDCLVVTTEGARIWYAEKYPGLNVRTVSNGYDKIVSAVPETDRFTIVYTGSFYKSRTPDLLFAALAKLEMDYRFISVGSDVSECAERYGITENVTSIPFVIHEKALGILATASLLFLKQGRVPGDPPYTAIAAKTFEYLATGIPILADVPEGDNADIIRRYSRNAYVVTSHDSEDVRLSIVDAHKKWSAGAVRLEVDREFIENFDRAKLTRDLVNVFDEIS